jgi:choline dehydrogenase
MSMPLRRQQEIPTAGYDYIVVGAGSAGCVIANRLVTQGSARVLLIEAGGSDRHPAFQIPKGFKLAIGNERRSWSYPTLPFGPEGQTEEWPRGKTLGGSSAINGLVWSRGGRDEFDAIERLGNPGWGWDTILPIYRAMEDHSLGASEMRGAGGPLRIEISPEPAPLDDEAFASFAQIGLRRVDDVNACDGERIGHTPANIKDGVRFSAARAFVKPLKGDPRLTVALHTRAVGLVLEGDRAVGVRCHRRGGQVVEYRCGGEVLLALGAIATPQLLELSGIGIPRVLEAAGVRARVAHAQLGERLREHRAVTVQWRLNRDLGYNRLLDTPLRQAIAGGRYLLTRRGVLSLPAYDLLGFCKTEAEAERCDAMLMFSPISIVKDVPIWEAVPESLPGISCVGTMLRPDSLGTTHIRSPDPYATPLLDPGYLTTEHDRRTSAKLARRMRELVTVGPLAELVSRETFPGPEYVADDQIAEHVLTHGNTGYHAIGTCAMGPADDDVVDPSLRVRGVEGLRVVDGSIIPLMPASNTNAPVMAMAWHAADVILGRSATVQAHRQPTARA